MAANSASASSSTRLIQLPRHRRPHIRFQPANTRPSALPESFLASCLPIARPAVSARCDSKPPRFRFPAISLRFRRRPSPALARIIRGKGRLRHPPWDRTTAGSKLSMTCPPVVAQFGECSPACRCRDRSPARRAGFSCEPEDRPIPSDGPMLHRNRKAAATPSATSRWYPRRSDSTPILNSSAHVQRISRRQGGTGGFGYGGGLEPPARHGVGELPDLNWIGGWKIRQQMNHRPLRPESRHREMPPPASCDIDPLPSTSNIHRVVGVGGELASGLSSSNLLPSYSPAAKAWSPPTISSDPPRLRTYCIRQSICDGVKRSAGWFSTTITAGAR